MHDSLLISPFETGSHVTLVGLELLCSMGSFDVEQLNYLLPFECCAGIKGHMCTTGFKWNLLVGFTLRFPWDLYETSCSYNVLFHNSNSFNFLYILIYSFPFFLFAVSHSYFYSSVLTDRLLKV